MLLVWGARARLRNLKNMPGCRFVCAKLRITRCARKNLPIQNWIRTGLQEIYSWLVRIRLDSLAVSSGELE